jgi:hypothetical protein
VELVSVKSKTKQRAYRGVMVSVLDWKQGDLGSRPGHGETNFSVYSGKKYILQSFPERNNIFSPADMLKDYSIFT